MVDTYMHGVYGESIATTDASDISQGTIPVYIGTLPVHRAMVATGGKATDYVNVPLLLSNYRDVKNLGLYSDDWEHFTICEALYVHFMSGDPVSPIIVVNMMNPDDKIAQTATTATVNLTKDGMTYIGYIDDPLCDISNMAVTAPSVTFNSGEVTYSYDGDRVKIVIRKNNFSATTVTATYKQVSFNVDDYTLPDFQTALDSVDNVEQITGVIPNILAAPHFSQLPQHHDLMVQKVADKFAEKWNAICVSDILNTVKTKEDANSWKNANGYNSKLDKVLWPSVSDGNKVVGLSTVVVYTMQTLDAQNGNIPYISPSNKVTNFSKICDGEGNTIYLTESEANELNENGITTVIPMKGDIRLWGSHMSNYNFNNLDKIADEDKFDVCVRMKAYLLNYLQYNYIDEIDQSMTRKDIDAIVNSVQTWLDSLVNEGMLLYASISFDSDDTDFPNGDVSFNVQVTYPVIAKSITFRLMYTKTGFALLNNEDGGDE